MGILIEAKNLYKSYKQKHGKVDALIDFSLNLHEKEVLSILGPNGAGKTTLINCLNGILIADKGEIFFETKPVKKHFNYFRSKIGAVLEGNSNIYYHMTPIKNLIYFGMLNSLSKKEAQKKGEELIEFMELKDFINEKVEDLSKGMIQKVAIAVALIHEPQILFLDEPTVGVDVVTIEKIEKRLKDLVKLKNISIILTTHQLDVAQRLSDRIIFIEKGKKIHEGSLSSIINLFSETRYIIEAKISEDNIEKLDQFLSKLDIEYKKEYESPILKLILKVKDNNQDSQKDEILKILSWLNNNFGLNSIISFHKDEEDDLESVFKKIYRGEKYEVS